MLAVPVQGVAEHRRKHFVYRQTGQKFERTEVEIGATNNRMVVVKSGIDVGDVIALDARSRAAEEFKDAEETENEDVTKLADQSAVSKAAEVKEATPKDPVLNDAAKMEETTQTEAAKSDTTNAQPTAEPVTSVEDTNQNPETSESAPAPSTTQP